MVMARAVSHKGDLFSIGFSVGAGIHAVERGTDGTNHLNVRLLRISADIVGFPWSAPCKHGMQRPGMILDIEPITYVAAVAIDRQWFASQGTDDDQRNKLFGERSEEHTSELQSLMRISYAVFCLQKQTNEETHTTQVIVTK